MSILERYSTCLEMNRKEKSWLDKMNGSINNPVDLVRHKMQDGWRPSCRYECQCKKACEDLWSN